MDTVPVSLDALQGLLAKSHQELQSALMTEKDGVKTPIDQINIDKYVTEATRARLTEIKSTGTSEATSAAKKLVYEEVEKYLHDNYGVQSKGGEGSWKKAISEANDNAKTKAQTSEEAVKASEHYKEVIAKLEAEEKAHQATKNGARDRILNQAFNKATLKALSDKSLNLALPTDETILAEQVEAFTLRLRQKAALEMVGEETIIPVSAPGKQLEDATYNKISLDQFIAINAKTFWPTVNGGQGRQAPPAGQPGQTGAPPEAGNKFPKWKDAEEFSTFVDKSQSEGKDSAFLKEALVAYESQTS